ncbi:MAG: membrane protein insertase YidC [Planctomycetota bacterium]|jgi:YidC/Oxa1 family membrane protein insertase
MDRNFGLAIALSFGVFILWFLVIVPAMNPPKPVDPNAPKPGPEQPGKAGGDAANGKAGQPGQPGAGNGNGNGGGAAAGQPEQPVQPKQPRQFDYPRTPEQPHHEVTLANAEIELVLTSTGGAVKSVTMRHHKAHVGSDAPLVLMRQFQTLVPARDGDGAPLTTPHLPLRLRLGGEFAVENGGDDLSALEWELIDGDPADHSVAFAFALGTGLRVVRRYTVVPAPPALAEGAEPPPVPEGELDPWIAQHRVLVEVTLENYDREKLRFVPWEMSGPAGIQAEPGMHSMPYGLAGWSFDGGSEQDLSVQPSSLEGGEKPQTLGGGAKLRFVGVCNPYFTAALAPVNAEPVGVAVVAVHPADAVTTARDRGPPAPGRDAILKESATELGVVVRHESRVPKASGPDAPGRYAQSYHLVVAAKEVALLEPMGLDDLRQGGWLDTLSAPMLYLLKGFRWATGSWGLGVVILTLLVRLCLHPFQKKAQISMHEYGQKMKIIQPELAKIKQIKDLQKQRQAQMELFQKHGVRPPLGCLAMVLQIPIFIAVYQVFLYSVELRHAPFLFIADLSQPDHLIPLPGGGFGPIPFLCCASLGKIAHINIIPIIWIILMQLNHKFSVTKIEDMTEQQQQQMKMMRYMTPLFGLMFWNIASAAGMYVLISTTWGMVESRFIRREIARREEAAKAGGALPPDAGKK